MTAEELAKWEDVRDIAITCTDGNTYFCNAGYFHEGDDNDDDNEVAMIDIQKNHRTTIWPLEYCRILTCCCIVSIEHYKDYIKRIQNK